MLTYGFLPFAIMLICSIIIIHKLNSSKKTNTLKGEKKIRNGIFSKTFSLAKNDPSFIDSNHQKAKLRTYCSSKSKEKQVTSILLTTNFIFFCLISPLLVMNVLNMLQEDTLRTTIAYFLCYANHG